MLADSDKQLLSYLGVGALDKSYVLVRLAMEGEAKGSQYFLGDKNDAAVNPINAAIDHAYIQHLRELDPISMYTWTKADTSKVTSLATSDIPVNLSAKVVDTAANYTWQSLFTGDVITLGEYNVSGGVTVTSMSNMPGLTNPSDPFTATEYGYMFNGSASHKAGAASFIVPDGKWKSYNTDAVANNETDRSARLNWPDLTGSDQIGYCFSLMAGQGLFEVQDLMTNIPLAVGWTSWNTNTACRQVYHPQVPGTRRIALFFNVPKYNGSSAPSYMNGYYTIAVTGYIWGEGADVYAYASGKIDGKQITRYLACGTMPAKTKVNIGKANCVTRAVNAYPLDGTSLLNTRIVGAMNLTRRSEYRFGLSTLEVLDYSFNVGRLYGSITPSDYYNYLTTGMGLYEPVSVEKAGSLIESWNNVNNGLFFQVRTCDLRATKVGPKQTAFYAEYGKQRAKACKDNNYMELPYNQEYTMKQVQNKIDALDSRTIWVANSATAAMSSSVSTSTGSLTFSADADARYVNIVAKTGSDSVNLRVLATEEGLSPVFDAYPLHTIVDPSNVLGSKIGNAADGSSLADLNAARNVNLKQFDLRADAYGIGLAMCYDDLVANNASNETKCAMLASQVTDFAKFEGTVQRWLNDFTHSKVVTNLGKNKTFSEINVADIEVLDITA